MFIIDSDGTETTVQTDITDVTETAEESTDIRQAGGEPENTVKKATDAPAAEKDVESISLTFYNVSLKVG